MLSPTEENYIKAIYHLHAASGEAVATNAISEQLQTTAASVTDMLKKLRDKHLITYEKYRGVVLTDEGENIAKLLVRNHRLWEVFLSEKLGFSWDKVHEVAEQLEHIKSVELIERLDKFLDYPRFDPHGDPIPDSKGNIRNSKAFPLDELTEGKQAAVVGVKDTSPKFLQYLDSLKISLGTKIEVAEVIEYDGSFVIKVDGKKMISISRLVVQNILVA